jgi:mannitol-specific phosphotransferase system IIBC component
MAPQAPGQIIAVARPNPQTGTPQFYAILIAMSLVAGSIALFCLKRHKNQMKKEQHKEQLAARQRHYDDLVKNARKN